MVKVVTWTNDQIIVGNVQNIYDTSKLTQKENSEVIQEVSHAAAHIRYKNIMNQTR